MKTLIINASPKRKGGTSRMLSRLLRIMLVGSRTQTESVCTKGDFARVLPLLSDIDALVISAPLYWDAAPSHLLEFLTLAERYCLDNGCRFKVYVVSNNGFIEGKQNDIHLDVCRCWCERAGLEWGGGVGVGGGVMLYALSIVYPALTAVALASVAIVAASGEAISFASSIPALRQIGWLIFWFIGVIWCFAALVFNIRSRKCTKNRFTRAMLPSPIFLVVADVFMFLASLFNGRIAFLNMGKDDPSKYSSEQH